MSRILYLLPSLLCWFTMLPTICAFTTTLFRDYHQTTTPCLYNANNDDPGEEPASCFDVEAARLQLESMVEDTATKNANYNISLSQLLESNDFLSFLPPPPPLSTIERDRRLAEIVFLKRLEDSDEARAELWNLWYSERGSTAQSRLQQTDQLLGDPTTWADCETKLVQLIDDFGFYFVEPLNRLATLYFLQGKFQDSYKLCQIILKLKPWHFGALAGIVQVCLGMEDRNAARVWAEKRLPNIVTETSFSPFSAEAQPVNPRRTEWVEEAVEKAKEMLKQAEKTTKQSLGKPEEYYNKPPSNTNQGLDKDGEADAWQ